MQLGKVRVAQQLVKARGTVKHVETASDNQRRELEAVAERSGWKVIQVYQDAGISGAKDRDQRPGLDAMIKAKRERVRHGRIVISGSTSRHRRRRAQEP
jgi:DNA invertase Pin-like site-specific DNA recombinase